MSLPEHLLYNVGGTVTINLNNVPTTASVRIIDGDGTEQVGTLSATVSTVDTVTNTAATRGDRAINVVSNVGMGNGTRVMLMDDPEEALVRKVDGATVHLRSELHYDHVSGAGVEGTVVTVPINSTQASSLFFDGHAEWNIDGAVYDYTAVECTKYPMRRHATIQDVLDVEAAWYQLKDPSLDVERWLDLAHQRVLKDIGAKSKELRVRVFPASTAFRHATALAALTLFYMRQPGSDFQDLYRTFKKELEQELSKMVPLEPRDADQDGAVEASERQGMGTVRLVR